MKEQTEKSGLAVGSMALGAIAGAIAAILFAPKSGRETREDIKDTLTRIKDETAEKLSEMKDLTMETYHSTVDSVLQSYKDAKEITEEQAGEIKADLQKGYEDVKQARSKAK